MMPSCTRASILALWVAGLLQLSGAQSNAGERALYKVRAGLMVQMKEAMLGSMRQNWEQGTAAAAVLEADDREYSVFDARPFEFKDRVPAATLRLANSAVVRRADDGRLSEQVGDNGSALDGASSGPVVLLGSYAQPSKRDWWLDAANEQLDYLLNHAPRTSTGAISHRSDSRQYWNDGVYMGPPFIAAYGAVTNNQTLLQLAYDQCRLYRDALRVDAWPGKLWAHIYSDDSHSFVDGGVWATGNAWAAMGMLRVQVTIMRSSFAQAMSPQVDNMTFWIKEILDGTFRTINDDNLIPDYIQGGPDFGDAAASAALASVAYRMATLHPDTFGANYTSAAARLRDAVLHGLDELGVMSPVVDPLVWNQLGTLSTEAQAFGVMMLAAWRDYLGL